jgi:hypothetical protein
VHGYPVNASDLTGQFACPKFLYKWSHHLSFAGLVNDFARFGVRVFDKILFGDQFDKKGAVEDGVGAGKQLVADQIKRRGAQRLTDYAVKKLPQYASVIVRASAQANIGSSAVFSLIYFICEWGIPYDTRFGL